MIPITIVTMTYNEEFRLPFMLNHYKTRFPECKFIIFDNFSTDNTVKIATENGCKIEQWDSNNKADDNLLTYFKNNAWKVADTDWVVIIDPDELIDITADQLKIEEEKGTTAIKPEGWNMVNMDESSKLEDIKYAYRHSDYDKVCLFNKKHIQEINYMHGAHRCNPTGHVVYNTEVYKLYHYHYVGLDFILSRYKMTAQRMSEANIKNRWGWHYLEAEDQIKAAFKTAQSKSTKIM